MRARLFVAVVAAVALGAVAATASASGHRQQANKLTVWLQVDAQNGWPDLVAATRRIQARLIAQRSEDFVGLAGLTIRTVSQGVIGVAVLQSLLAGIGLKLAAVPHAGVLAFAVLILAILQIGSVIVILPVVIWIWATKEFTAALLLTIYLLIVSLADNVLKPMLMGRGLSTPMFVIFIGVMGGMLAHGIGQGGAAFYRGPHSDQRLLECRVLLVRTQNFQTLHQRQAGINHDRELAEKDSNVFHRHPARAKFG